MVVQCGYNEAVKSLTMFNSIKIPPRSPGMDGGAARGRTEEPGNFAWEQNVAEESRSGGRPVNETSGKIAQYLEKSLSLLKCLICSSFTLKNL